MGGRAATAAIAGALVVGVLVSDLIVIPVRVDASNARRQAAAASSASRARAGADSTATAAYLTRLRAPLDDVFADIGPWEQALALAPFTPDVQSDAVVRDTIAGSPRVARAVDDLRAVGAIAVPPDASASVPGSEAAAVAGSLAELLPIVEQLPSLRTLSGAALAESFSYDPDSTFSSLELALDGLPGQVDGAFQDSGITPPDVDPPASASHDTFVLGVDTACLAGLQAGGGAAAVARTYAAILVVPAPPGDPGAAEALHLAALAEHPADGSTPAEARSELGGGLAAYGALLCGSYLGAAPGASGVPVAPTPSATGPAA